MNKLLTDTCQCGCNPTLPENLLKITAGNDFSIKLQLTEKIDDNWVHYDMTDMSNVTVSVVSPNNTATELDYIIDVAGNIQAIVDAQKFQSYIIYGVEVLWTDETDVVPVDKRAYAPNVFAFVNSSMEATDSSYEYTSDSPYEYNISMSNDVVLLSIGYIPDVDLSDYYTKDEIDSTLENYATDQDDADAIAVIDTSNFYTKSEIDTTLTSYGTSITNDGDRLAPSINIEKVFSLRNSSGDSISSFTIQAFNKYIESGGGWHIVPSSPSAGLILRGTVETIYNTEDRVAAIESDYITSTSLNNTLNDYAQLSDLSDYVTNTSLNTTLNDYVTDSELTTALNPYATQQYVDNAVAHIDTSNFYTKTEIDTTLQSYVKTSVLSDYVTNTSLNTTLVNYVTNTSLATTLQDYVTDTELSTELSPIESDITSLDGRVTTLEQSGGGGTIPSNVVTSDDGNEIVCLTQSEYDTLEQNDQLDSDVFYYITDATSNYVTNSDLTNAINNLNIPTATSDLTNDSNFVVSTSITTILQISQSDYDTLVNNSQVDANTLYIIV